ncbi:choice-of-anchor C family protein [Sphingomonas sp.]|uniref:choice-of-anchor C family protein n=1 Tax=Sphingomonas sp. TaxID=28214 RepID=UPI003B00F633
MKLLLAAAAAVSFGSAADAQSFANGSFEDGAAPGSFTTLNGGSTVITGWTVTGNSVDYIGDYWNADTGSRSIDLNGNGQGGIQQTFSTIAGRSYTVGFSLAGNPDGAPATKTVSTIASDGGASQIYTFDSSGSTRSNMGWLPYTYSFLASGGSTTLSFASGDTGSYGAALDSVSVSLSAVPEPATWALMILGFGLTGGAMRRRRATSVAFA